MVRAAIDGIGLAYVMESAAAEALADKKLVRVLQPYCPRFPGYFLYYASRTQLPSKLQALVELLRARRR
jgi:DNA-binding transcriptional LysR family regulator